MVLVSVELVQLGTAKKWGKSFRLDELPEFSRNVLEVMRQPLEDRIISISRAKYSTEYPASFMLVASMNPCPCGYYGHPKKKCVCNEYQRTHYMSKISGPLLDRIDLQIEVQPVDFDQMSSKAPGEPTGLEKLRDAMERMNMSARAYDRILKVARTIAYRNLDRPSYMGNSL